MSGKDLIDSVKLGSQICRILGARPPEGFNYELFLDEHAKKISKSKGNGLSAEEWLTYGPTESLAYFMFQKPRAAKRPYFDVLPRAVDDYLSHLQAHDREAERRLENTVWHIPNGEPPVPGPRLVFGMLLTLASLCTTADTALLGGF